jgi:hypothetical protein
LNFATAIRRKNFLDYNGLSEGKMTPGGQRFTVLVWKIENPPTPFGRDVPLKPRLAGGAKGH